MDKRFIEDSFPVKEVSFEAAKEKSIRHGHISTLHIWWARKPLAYSKTTIFTSLIPTPKDEIDWIKKKNFIIDLSKWNNSLNEDLIEEARNQINQANNGPVRILDPFSGGAALPFEALRLGCETYANDYNPVAVILEKCALEFPQKYGNKLIKDVKKWANIVLDNVKADIGEYYPNFKDNTGYFGHSEDYNNIPIGYYWMWNINCQNPSCESEIPLTANWWLSRKKNKHVALYPRYNHKSVDFDIFGDGYEKIPEDFNPDDGTVKRASVKCPQCGTVVEAKDVRNLFNLGKSWTRMIAIIYRKKGKKGKFYRIAEKEDIETYNSTKELLNQKINFLKEQWGLEPVPNEEIPLMSGTFNVPIYGFKKWGDLFNYRQKLALITFTEKVRESYKKMIDQGVEKDYAIAITTYLAILIDRLADKNTILSRYHKSGEKIENTFGRPALPMIWDHAEINVFSGANGDWLSQMKWVLRFLEHAIQISDKHAKVTHASATDLPYEDNYFDAVFTDPPYYNSVPYADLSDFFYVWLKRSVGHIYPSLFATPLSPKTHEVIEMASWDKRRYAHKTQDFFEERLKESFREMYRVLKPNGIANIVYAHKTTEGWETVINALMESGLIVTASWPISTEMTARLRSQGSATLASSICIVARKSSKNDLGWLKDVKEEIRNHVPEKLDKLWGEGISGADFFVAAIGLSIEIFGKYEKILDNEGNQIKADKLLNFIRGIVTDYTVRNILHNGIADELSALTKFYLLWRWNYMEAKVPFDEARKLAQSSGIDLTNEWNKGFIVKSGEFISVIGPNERDSESLEDSIELIDVLHLICLLWKDGSQDNIKFVLKKSGYDNGEALYKVAQAISETLPNNSSEKKMIEGFLAGKERIMQDIRDDDSQTKLV